jgi:ribonuclease-3
MDPQDLRKVEQIIGYHFRDPAMLIQAFHHASAVGDRVLSNERQEFLGDAVLGLVICEALFERFPGYLEGDLTKIKSVLVSRRTCAKVTKELGLQEHLLVGKGMSGSRALTGSLSAALLEAVVAAVYQDGGLPAAKEFVLRVFGPMIEQADAGQTHGNYKSLLQQHAQQRMGVTPLYNLLDEKGPDHNKCFEAEAIIAERHFSSAWGTNKKEAEQKAAYNALVELGLLRKSDD